LDAEQFLRTVVPADGIKYLGVLAKDAPRPAHYQFEHYGQMAQAAQQWDARGADVYFALASYKPATQATDKTGALVFHPDGRPKMLKRTASLAKRMGAFNALSTRSSSRLTRMVCAPLALLWRGGHDPALHAVWMASSRC
jgi:hypothetical protein